ncbi:hypothetical protein D9611_000574 [Ephemerocybe angulata]|uniref:Uncharacterized protein n=1 Tax=Ephemerocybe angulata TaxID=980116 RepID=A0A8H5BNK4_9AGAR|nr:hypothetical protein D9611_000574 [Tulosesus angulatus]
MYRKSRTPHARYSQSQPPRMPPPRPPPRFIGQRTPQLSPGRDTTTKTPNARRRITRPSSAQHRDFGRPENRFRGHTKPNGKRFVHLSRRHQRIELQDADPSATASSAAARARRYALNSTHAVSHPVN